MSDDSLILYEEDIKKIETLLSKLIKGAEAKCALLVDKDKQPRWRVTSIDALEPRMIESFFEGFAY